jgi:hypothetical protein
MSALVSEKNPENPFLGTMSQFCFPSRNPHHNPGPHSGPHPERQLPGRISQLSPSNEGAPVQLLVLQQTVLPHLPAAIERIVLGAIVGRHLGFQIAAIKLTVAIKFIFCG